MDARECYGTHDAGGLQGFHCPQPRGTVPKERYTHIPRSLRRVRHARCFNGECPSEATDKIGMRHIYWSCCQNATSLSPISPLLLLWKRQRRGLAAPPPRISFTSWRVCSRNIPCAPLPVAAWMPERRVGVLPAYRRCERCCASQQNRSLMSALGHKQTKRPAWTLSALPPKADKEQTSRGVRPWGRTV